MPASVKPPYWPEWSDAQRLQMERDRAFGEVVKQIAEEFLSTSYDAEARDAIEQVDKTHAHYAAMLISSFPGVKERLEAAQALIYPER